MIARLYRGWRRWWLRRRDLGRRGERVAARHLRRNGYRILARNLRNRLGEIDLLAQPIHDPQTIVIVEVKAAVQGPYPPELHVDHHKRRKLVTLTAPILRAWRLTDRRVRYDVIGVVFPDRGRPIVRHHPGAFESHV